MSRFIQQQVSWRATTDMAAMTVMTVGLALGSTGLVAGSTQQRDIRIPDNPPTGVNEEMRVKTEDVDAVLADPDVVLLDVREPWELELYGTRKGYINIPLAELEERLDELPKDKTILTA